MNCEYDFCIYNKESACILDEIQVDSLGLCETCETVTVPKEILDKYKRRRLTEIAEIWKNYDK